MATPRYLALDPGETTGWATFDENGVVLELGQFKQKDQTKELTRLLTSDLLAVICEDYRNYFGQKKWSKNQTSKNIGGIEMLCEMRQVPIHLQPANIKAIGYKWANMVPPSNHAISHQYDAFVHGVYWLKKNDICPPEMYLPNGM